ncbi:unnamed protein product [Lota lota]
MSVHRSYLAGQSDQKSVARTPTRRAGEMKSPAAMPQDAASGWPLTRICPGGSTVSALSRVRQRLRPMPQNPRRPCLVKDQALGSTSSNTLEEPLVL